MAGDFWLGVAQTTIGSAVGFVFGIFAFHHQQRRQSAKKAENDWRTALDALNRLSVAAGANIEALANSKLQLVGDLAPEIDKMKAVCEENNKTLNAEHEKQVQGLVETSGSMLHFFKSLPETSVMAPPDFSEYSALSKDMPALTLFVHRAMGMMQDLNEHIRSRNELLAQHALENGAANGMTGHRVIYFTTMLSDHGDAICNSTDFALDFWRLVLDQIKAYMTVKAKGEHFVEYKLVPNAKKAMPNEELFPLMREQLATFEA